LAKSGGSGTTAVLREGGARGFWAQTEAGLGVSAPTGESRVRTIKKAIRTLHRIGRANNIFGVGWRMLRFSIGFLFQPIISIVFG
jgi:hypothetical protein